MSFTSLVDNVLFFFSAARGAINDNIIVFTFKLLVSIKFQASLIAQLVKNPPAMQETPVQFLGWEGISWRRDRLPTSVFLGFSSGSVGTDST